MDKGAFGVHEEHVRDPDLLYEPAIERHAQVVRAWKRQPLVLPIVPQIEGHGEVLQVGGRAEIYPPTVGDIGLSIAPGEGKGEPRKRPRTDRP